MDDILTVGVFFEKTIVNRSTHTTWRVLARWSQGEWRNEMQATDKKEVGWIDISNQNP